jgi:L-arabinose transport system ATP-binding protein
VYGLEKILSGSIVLKGKHVAIDSPARAMAEGIVFGPEDRKLEGIIPVLDVNDNISICVRRRFARAGLFIDKARERANTAEFIERLQIKTPNMEQLAGKLSGGNQQKVILARNLSMQTELIILDEPTRGIDVGTKSEIYRLIYRLAESGKAVIVVSSDLPEIIGICDRILVMRDGKIVKEIAREQATEQTVLKHALSDLDANSSDMTAAAAGD